ncbi:DUF2357 domain-containing protein [Xanthomonas euvesicatoria]|uniref:DUF2357 domain-containing protein n=1 Tax=Xanthomonas euvesicatoria TaxID=456327 RepID=UPI00070CA290|nr:DUF2357 domain-containing protein [Xanthomonas euvesicatoria]MCC8613060.1 restriction endonuclease-like protein [Xanthomonas euvesicatoria pv. euvesicatoria]
MTEFVALHRVKFDLGSGTSIDIEAALGRGRQIAVDWAAPDMLEAEVEIDVAAVTSGSMLPMCWREAGHLFERFQLREDTDYFVDISLPISLDEATKRAEAGRHWPFGARLANVFKRDPSRRWKETVANGQGAVVVTGQLRLRSHAGVIDLGVEFGRPMMAEVACRKLKYFEEFKELLDSLAGKAAELLLSLDSPVSLSFDPSGDLSKNDAALHFLMRHIMSSSKLPLAIDEIAAQPHSKLMEQIEFVRIDEIQEADPELISDGFDPSEMVAGGPLSRMFRGYTPTGLPRRDSFETLDTPENRYAKAFLAHCALLARQLEARMGVGGRRASQREAKAWAVSLDEALQHSMWSGVGPLGHIPSNSQALLRRRGYKELFHFDLSLRMSLSLAWRQGAELADGLIGDIRPVNQIYEYWCFFMLREALLGICSEMSGGNFICLPKDGLSIQLTKGRRSECRFEFVAPSGNRVLASLFYNQRFTRSKLPKSDWSGSYTASFAPDFSIVISPAGHPSVKHWLHFDAKYRLERMQAEALFESEEDVEASAEHPAPPELAIGEYEIELARVHKQDDLYKMHTYRDGILGTRGAYVLFPGDTIGGRTVEPSPNLFVRHPSALGGGSEHRIPSVGVFDLAPGGSPDQIEAIADLIRAALTMAAQDAPYQEEQANFSPMP